MVVLGHQRAPARYTNKESCFSKPRQEELTTVSLQERVDIARPISCPAPGVVAGFDAGWNAHQVGLERDSVTVFTTDPQAREWALLAWDARESVRQSATKKLLADPLRLLVASCRCSVDAAGVRLCDYCEERLGY